MMKPILTLSACVLGLAVFVGLLVDEVGVMAAVSAVGVALCLVVGLVVVLFNDWGGGRDKTR